jgi:hypothetical protein
MDSNWVHNLIFILCDHQKFYSLPKPFGKLGELSKGEEENKIATARSLG